MAYIMHPIETIEGIGSKFGAGLRQQGIVHTEDLLALNDAELQRKTAHIPRFPSEMLPALVAAARFLQMNAVDHEVADAFVELGWRHLEDIVPLNVDTFQEKLAFAQEKGWLRHEVTLQQMVDWQKAALTLLLSGTLAGRIVADTNAREPLDGVTVSVGFHGAETGENGRFWLPGVPLGRQAVVIRKENYQTLELNMSISADAAAATEIPMKPGQDPRQLVDEAAGERIRTFGPGDELEFKDVEPHDLAEDTPLTLRHRYVDGRVRLQSVYRQRIGYRIIVKRVIYPEDSVPADVPINRVFLTGADGLEDTGQDLADFVKHRFFAGNPLGEEDVEFITAGRI